MLVLSRRSHEDVVFPNLGITVRILKVGGKLVKIGIDAPPEISVLRSEAVTREGRSENAIEAASPKQKLDCVRHAESPEAIHKLRNELNLLQLRITAIQRKLELGQEVEADKVVSSLLGGFDELEGSLAPATVAPEAREHIKLLVVEDSDNERKLMAYALATFGFDVVVARDGQEALDILRTYGPHPNVVLMDVEMPLAGGLETLHEIRSDERLAGLTVYAVTGSKRNRDEEPIGRGWDGWFTKPLDMKRLIEAIVASGGSVPPAKSFA